MVVAAEAAGEGAREKKKTSLICRSVKPPRAPGRTSRETSEEREGEQLSPLSFLSFNVSFTNKQLKFRGVTLTATV